MRPRSLSTSTTRTEISSPLLRTSSTVVDPLAGRDVGDVQQAVGALGELDERAERRRLDDLRRANSSPTSTSLVIDRIRSTRASPCAPVCGVDEHVALVVDVDLRLELARTGRGSSRRPCRSAGRSCRGSIWIVEMRGAKLESSAARRRRSTRAILPRMCSRPSRACVSASRRISNVTPVILMSICSAVMPVLRAGDLEVHVAEVVLDAGDVGEDGVVVALLDQAHRDARDRRLDRHARVHQRQRGAADRGHRRRAVGLEDVRHDADRVRELLAATGPSARAPARRARRGRCRGAWGRA